MVLWWLGLGVRWCSVVLWDSSLMKICVLWLVWWFGMVVLIRNWDIVLLYLRMVLNLWILLW